MDSPSKRRFGYRLWQPRTPRALLVVIHGFGEHAGRYHPFALELAREDICVAAPDLWGHGRSGGGRGDVGSVAECARQFGRMVQEVFVPAVGETTYTVFGHSFGGLVAITWALESPPGLQRVILQSPLLDVAFPIPPWKTAAAAILASCWPSASFAMGLDVEALSHDTAVVQAYRDDPLVHDAISARTYRSIRRAAQDAVRDAHTMRVPVLLLYGDADRIVSVEAAQRWWESLRCVKHRVVFPGCYHELHHEVARGEVLRWVRDWTLGSPTAT